MDPTFMDAIRILSLGGMAFIIWIQSRQITKLRSGILELSHNSNQLMRACAQSLNWPEEKKDA